MSNINYKSQEKKLALKRFYAFFILCFEQIWQILWPLAILIASFAAVTWLGLFARFGFWPHLIAVWFYIFVFFIIVARLRYFKRPELSELDRHIELANNLKFHPLETQTDGLTRQDNPLTQLLWREHKRRMALELSDIAIGYPHPDIPSRDPYALRTVVFLLAALAFAFSFRPNGPRLIDAFSFSDLQSSAIRVDAWIDPPSYTGIAPIFITQTDSAERPFKIPAHSKLVIRLSQGDHANLTLLGANGSKQVIPPLKNQDANNPSAQFEVELQTSAVVNLSNGSLKRSWTVDVTADKPPTIELTEAPPKLLPSGYLEFDYQIGDEYGVVKAWVDIEPLAEMRKIHALYPAPDLPLILPRTGKGQAHTIADLSNHPWAGSEVRMRLVAEDGAGNRGYSQYYTIVMPEKIFHNPLARAVMEQRRLLALNALTKNRVLDMLAALVIRPENTIRNASQLLALQSLWTRLSLVTDDDGFRNVVDYMWHISLGIEGDQSEDAAAKLRQAENELRDALRNGASSEEIDRLTKQLQQAMLNYMGEKAREAKKNGFDAKKLPHNTKIISRKELDDYLNKLRELAETGDRSAAEQLLSQLENMMNHLQFIPQAQGDNQKDPMQQQLDALSDLMQRQQQTLNDTAKLNGGDRSGDDSEPKMHDLGERQHKLAEDLQTFREQLDGLQLKPDKSLDEAQQAMRDAETEIGNNNGGGAMNKQAQALDALRRSGQSLLAQINKAAGRSTKTDLDPLGRSLGHNRSDSKLPSERETQRAKSVLDEIRKRLGSDALRPAEKQYLERLLKFDR